MRELKFRAWHKKQKRMYNMRAIESHYDDEICKLINVSVAKEIENIEVVEWNTESRESGDGDPNPTFTRP